MKFGSVSTAFFYPYFRSPRRVHFRTETIKAYTLWITAPRPSLLHIVLAKKYIDQEPPYLMRQICVLQWEEIKKNNSGATRHF